MKRYGTRSFLAFLAVLSFSSEVVAQDVSFEASVDKNPVAQGEQFTLSLILTNAGMGGGKNLKPPDLASFHIMGGPNQSTSMQFINGVVTSSVTYSYILQAKDPGKFIIGPASIEAGGKTLATKPITIEVAKGTSRPRQPTAQGDVSEQIGENLFLRATVDKTHVIQGEQINLTFKLYTRVSVSNYTVSKNPTFTGFWGEDVETPKNIALSNETVNGRQYRVGIIKRVALFPTQSGTLEISPMEVQTTVQIQDLRSSDPFDAFFRDPFGRNVNYAVKSEPLKIKVDPLPAGAPPSFKGAVGRFTMNTTVDKKTTKTNEPISLKVSISGSGNIKILESPQLELPVDFEQYTPKVSDNVNRQEQLISGSKTFEYLLIPRYPGRKVIKPVTFSFFDLSKREYVTLRSPEIELNVEPGAAGAGPFVSSSPREDVRLLSQDIRFIKVGNSGFSRKGERLHTSGFFVVLLVLPLAGLAGAFVYSRQRQAEMRDIVGYRNRRAIKVAQRGLRQAELMLKGITSSGEGSGREIQFYSEIGRAMWKYLGDKLNISPAEISIDGAVNALARRAVNGEISTSLKSLLETCEMARFSPAPMEIVHLQKTYDDAKKIIVELERALK